MGSARDARGEVGEGVLDTLARPGAARAHPPAIGAQLLEIDVRNRPLLAQVVLVDQQRKRQRAVFRLDALAQRQRRLERRHARAVSHQHIARRAAHVAHAQRCHVVLAREIPQDQMHRLVAECHRLLVDLHADRGQVGLGEDALDVALYQARLADRKTSQHTNLLLLYAYAHGSSSMRTATETRRLSVRALSELCWSSGSSWPAPPIVIRSAATPRFFRSASTAPARAMLSERL